ncbi:hypothetical protein JCM11641_008436 [Rhodosporidiobolus odoratus]
MTALTVDDLRAALAALNLDTRGTKDFLKKRLAKAKSKQRTSPPPHLPQADLQHADATLQGRPEGQEYDSYLVFDVEATCEKIEGAHGRLAFSYPNEIIEFPVILLQWRRRAPPIASEGREGNWELVKTDEFHSFVKPTWRPRLSDFCTELTGIEQKDVDTAPTFPQLCKMFYDTFCLRHRLFTPSNKTVWVTDGPWDLRDFVAKTCYLSRTARPDWLAGDIVDLRIAVSNFFSTLKDQRKQGRTSPPAASQNPFSALSSSPSSSTASASAPTDVEASAEAEAPLPSPIAAHLSPPASPPQSSDPSTADPIPVYLPSHLLTAPSTLSIPSVLASLTLPPFTGRLHSGLSDARNASRILIDLAARGVGLETNRRVPEGGKGGKEKRWGWMTRRGEVKWEEHVRWERGKERERERDKVGKVEGYVRREETG